MRLRTMLAAALFVMASITTSFAQQQTGEIFGRLVDKSGAILPGDGDGCRPRTDRAPVW